MARVPAPLSHAAGQPAQRQLLNQLVVWAREGSLTLLYGARDKERNQAVVLRSVLEELL
jgi:uncharacterized protein YeaO (DUF488 family)